MKEAIKEAKKALKKGEVPVGAILVDEKGDILARGYNIREKKNDPSAHAEIIVIRKACKKLNNWRLEGCSLYVTLQPCLMCFGALIQARIKKLIFGAYDSKGNILEAIYLNYNVEVKGGVLEEECSKLLKSFFKVLRDFSRLKVYDKI
ncbi:MAG: nucleoside deaminase [Dictyoglomaceae bacterium]|nr:nucleoside deaminase [Dictyoglomaceae bacterium]